MLLSVSCAISLLTGLASAAPLPWTNTEGKTIQAEFVRLDGESVVIRMNGKDLPIPLAKLSLASRNQARELGAKSPAQADGPVEASAPAKSFGKQEDPEHQRKLAESILAKKGTIEIWRDEVPVPVGAAKDLPKGRIELKAIEAIGSPFTDEDAILLNGCKRLTRLHIQRATLQDLPLGSLDALESIEFVDCNVSVRTLEGLRGHKTLRAFSLWRSTAPVGKGLVPILASIPTIDYINLHQAGLDEDPLGPLAKLRNLRVLHLGANRYSEEQLAELGGFPALEELYLANSMFLEHSLAFLPKIKTLLRLWLHDSQLSESILPNVAAMPSLIYLNLSGTNVNDGMLKALGGQRSLRELHLLNTAVNGSGFQGVKPLPSLTRLELHGPRTLPDDAGCAAIASAFPNLNALVLNAKGIGPAGLQALRNGLKGLTLLHLHEAIGFDETGAATVAEMKALSDLAVFGANLTPAIVTKLLPLKSRLRFLELSVSQIGDDSVELLAQFRFLESLGIRSTRISKDGVAELQAALKSCKIWH